MGLLVKHRKKFISHKKRWDKQTITDEAILVKDYALKNKKEIRKVGFLLAKYKKLAKELNRTTETKESNEAMHFIDILKLRGFLKQEQSALDDILDIKLRDILERRLSNIVYKSQMSATPKQARQIVVHGHIRVGEMKITSPSYLVSIHDEAKVRFDPKSDLAQQQEVAVSDGEGGLKEKLKEMDEIPLKKNEGPNFDEKESQFDDEEVDEVVE